MENDYVVPSIRLALALLAGAFIGLERTYHGRPAGFRTHTLVCTASCLLMLVPIFYVDLIPEDPLKYVSMDPTRMAQGIVTGIGFLGAGVILKEGLTVRGLTTAASIWMTASIGIAIGLGFYFPALVAEIMAVGTLSTFRWVETRIPAVQFARLTVWLPHDSSVSEDELVRIVSRHKMSSTSPSYSYRGQVFQYEMTVRTGDSGNLSKLAETLRSTEGLEYSIVPA